MATVGTCAVVSHHDGQRSLATKSIFFGFSLTKHNFVPVKVHRELRFNKVCISYAKEKKKKTRL